MISKQTANRIKEIDFETIIKSKEPGGLIRHLALHAQNLDGDKKHKFFAASVTYYCYLMNIKNANVIELNKDHYLLLWVNSCLVENSNLLTMLAGIYQLLEWEKGLSG